MPPILSLYRKNSINRVFELTCYKKHSNSGGIGSPAEELFYLLATTRTAVTKANVELYFTKEDALELADWIKAEFKGS